MIRLLAGFCACCCLSQPVLAWDGEGHMVTAQIAYNHLDPVVKAKCDALIAVPVSFPSSASTNFVTAACWADDIKSSTSAYSIWHYIDLPFSLDGTSTNNAPPPFTNVVWAIRQSIATLQDPAAAQTNQATALRFLLHFAGDIHQPLHSSTAVSAAHPTGDAGGNSFNLAVGGTWSNLHSLWDAGGGFLTDSVSRPLSVAAQTTISNKAAAIEAAYPYSLSIGTIPDPANWATESWGIAKSLCYSNITAGSTPSTAYTNTAQATTQQRMAIGGQRLAKLLSTIFVTNGPSVTSVTLTNGNFGLSWSAVPGRSYRLQWKQQSGDAIWNDLINITAAANTASYTEATVQQQRFYRVIVVN